MFVILSLFLLCALFAYSIETSQDEKSRKSLIAICLMYMALISGTRLIGGSDFFVYEGHYNALPTFPDVLNPDKRNLNYETGYTYFAAFFKTLGISFYGFCIIESSIFYFCLWKGLNYFTKHFGVVILVFLYKLFFYNTMISMRQSLTVALFFLMVPLIVQRKWIKYYILAFIASKFHNGAYVLFLIYPVSYFSLSKSKIRWLNIIFFPTLFIGLAGIDVLGPIGSFLADHANSEMMLGKAQGYFDNENLSPIGIFHTLEYYLLMLVFYLHCDKINFQDSKTRVVVWLFLCLLPLFTLFRGSEILTREKDYFTIYYAVIIGYLLSIMSKWKKLIYAFVFVICAFGYYRYVILFDNMAFCTYRSWLFNPNYSFFLGN